MEEIRQAQIYGVRPIRTFEQAAAKFILENQHKRSLRDDIGRLKGLLPWIGDVPLDKIHMGILQFWISQRQSQGRANGTINHGLQLIRRIVNLAASEWIDDDGLTWLAVAPKIKLLPNFTKKAPYPLSWSEQARLLKELPAHLEHMACFAVNTGCRDSEICSLRWDWEVQVKSLQTSVFIIPGTNVKNGYERLVVLNDTAKSIIDLRRGCNPSHVFTYKGKPITRMLNSAWLTARKRAGLSNVRVHDLKHTFGRRLRAADVSFEDRQDLLGHKSGRVTTHYSAAELSQLIAAANRVCEKNGNSPEIIVLRSKFQNVPQNSRKAQFLKEEKGANPLKSLVAEEGLEPPTRGL